jgi:hypothetical protein
VHGMVGDDESASGRPGGQAGQSSGLAPELPSELAARKAELRLRVLGARRRLSPAERALAGRELRDAILEDPQTQMAGVVAAYVSVGSEPDTRALIFALWKRGTYVLLPLLRPDQDLDWASYEGPDSLIEGPRGLVEPSEPPRGVEAITSADLVLVPPSPRAGSKPSPARTWCWCRPWPPTAWATGSAGAAGPTTGPWPGSARPCPPSPCCTRTS